MNKSISSIIVLSLAKDEYVIQHVGTYLPGPDVLKPMNRMERLALHTLMEGHGIWNQAISLFP